MKRKILSVLLAVFLAIGLMPTMVLAQSPIYLALGDSITTGYRLNDGEQSFAQQVAEKGFELVPCATNGETSGTLLSKLQNGSIDVSNAELITITIGGNDLMEALYAHLAEKWNENHPDDPPKTADDIRAILTAPSIDTGMVMDMMDYLGSFATSSYAQKALEDFEKNLSKIATTIKQKSPNATLIVATQYNPYSYLASVYGSLPQIRTIHSAFDQGITSLNAAINQLSANGEKYLVADVYNAFESAVTSGTDPCNASVDISPSFQIDLDLDFHPNEKGHGILANTVVSKLNMVTGIAITPLDSEVAQGQIKQFTATVSGIGNFEQTVNWSVTGNTDSQTEISAEGSLTVGAAETATKLIIRATSTQNSAKFAETTITVKIAPSITTASLPEGTVGTTYRQALAADGTTPISWSVTEGALPDGLTLSSDGTITGEPTTAGTSTFTVIATNSVASVSKKYTLTIKPAVVSVTGVALDKSALSLTPGKSETLIATVAPNDATNQNVTWSSNNADVATVDQNGIVTAVKAGTATITVTTADGNKTASCNVTVTQPVTGVTLDKSELSLFPGESETLTATVAPNDATNQDVTWKSSNDDVATVTDGEVTAVKAGTATITVTTADGNKTASCNVTVTQPVTGVKLDKSALSLFPGESETLTATVAPNDATNQEVTWKSSNDDVATVTDGEVTAVKAGTATITVTTADGNKTASCNVTVTDAAYSLSADPSAIDFGTVKTGYTQPGAKTVTVTNTGNQSLTLQQPKADHFDIGELSQTELAPGESATFTVQPKAKLPFGTFNDSISISAASVSREAPASVTITAQFTVERRTADAANDNNKDQTSSPQTGDDSNLLLWGVLAVVALAGMVCILVMMKRKR